MGSCTDSLALQLSTMAKVWKMLRLFVKETHLLIFKNQLKGHGLPWNLSQMEVLVGATFALSLASTGRLT